MGVVVGRSFEVVYDDFSGGHFVGQVGTRQPKNTFVGYDVGPDPSDGCLVPLGEFFTINNALAGDAASSCTDPLILAGSNAGVAKVIWAGSAHVYTTSLSPPVVSPVAVNSAVLAGAYPRSVPAYFAPQDKVLIPNLALTSIFGIDITGASPVVSTTTALPANMQPGFGTGIVAYGEFAMFATGFGKIYFSNPSVATTWTATDWFSCPAGTVTLLVHQGSLYIGAQNGWWVASGIPGSTLSLRQLTTVATGWQPVSIDTSIVSAGLAVTSLIKQEFAPNGPLFRELVGSRDRALSWGASPDGRYPYYISQATRVGPYMVARSLLAVGTVVDEGGASTVLGTTLWILDTRTGTWTRRQVPVHTIYSLASWREPAGDLLVYRTGSPDNHYFASLSLAGLYPDQDGTYQTATAELAEHYHPVQFHVKEVLCEVDYGTIPTSGENGLTNLDRSIAVYVKTPGVIIDQEQDLTLSRAKTSTLTQVLPTRAQVGANFTRRRSWVRFNPTDGNSTFNATPVVTLTGCKLRRLVLRCQEDT